MAITALATPEWIVQDLHGTVRRSVPPTPFLNTTNHNLTLIPRHPPQHRGLSGNCTPGGGGGGGGGVAAPITVAIRAPESLTCYGVRT